MKNKKWKWWMVLIPILLTAVILTVVFWDTIVMYAAPEAALTPALTNTAAQLEERFRDNPIQILVNAYNPEGKYTADVQLDTTNALVGNVSYDMTAQIDLPAHRICAEGTVGFSGSMLDLSAYLDSDFLAVSSGSLLKGSFYGITYDTFAEDIRSFPLLKLVIPDATITEWKNSISKLQEQMNKSYALPELPEITAEDMHMLILGLLTLRSDVEKEIISLQGESLECWKITYSAAGEDVKEILDYLMDTEDADDASMTASFYLFEGAVIKLDLSGTSGANSIQYSLALGKDAATAPLSLEILQNEKGSKNTYSFAVQTERGTDQYAEAWDIHWSENGVTEAFTFSYDRNTATGDMMLTIQNSDPIAVNLMATEDGFRLATDEFTKLTNVLTEDDKTAEKSCVMTVRQGAEITTPEYKNMSQWSMDDFFVLLGGLGSLIGLKWG